MKNRSSGSNRPLLWWGLVIVLLTVLSLLALMLIPQSRGAEQAKTPDYWPTQGWRTSTPEEQGFDSAKLAEGLLAIRQGGFPVHSLLIIRNGAVVADAYFYPYDGKTVHKLASVTKSLMTTLIAIAADQGKLSLDQPMVSFFPERTIANRDALKERITVRHLASMSSGLDSVGFARDEGTLADMRASADWVQFALDRKVVAEPGTRFVYDSPGIHLLSAILQKATGMTALDFARANLFEPLGIRDVIWPQDPQGYNHGWGDVHLYPRDAAKLGYLWLSEGVWDGRQIVSREWVKNAVKAQIKTYQGDDYGYGWWVTTEDGTYTAVGRGGQYVKVVVRLNTIVAMTGGGFDYDSIEPFLTPVVVDPEKPLPANPAGVAKLNAALVAITQAPTPQTVAPLPETAKAVSGKTFTFEPNPKQLKSLRLEFDDSAEARMQITFADNQKPRAGNIGLDGLYRLSPGAYDLPVGQKGYWADAQTFVLNYNEIANGEDLTVRVRFAGDRVTLEMRERSQEGVVRVEGRLQSP